MNHKKRVRLLQKSMTTTGILVSHPHDVFYYSGFLGGVDDMPLFLIKKTGTPLILLSQLVGNVTVQADTCFDVGEFRKSLPHTLGIDEHHMPARLYQELKRKHRLSFVGDAIKKPREVKDPEEISRMEKAIRINKKVLSQVGLFGKREDDVAREIERGFLEAGASLAFETIVSSGPNVGRYIHHTPGNRVIQKGEMVIVDFGARWKGYSSDITRTFFSGKKQRDLVDIVYDIQQQCIDLVAPGVPFREINTFYQKALEKQGFPVHHGIGHGIGIFVHESASVLQENMVITIEPGIYLKSMGCRIEDMVLVKKKPRVLSRSIPLHR